MVLEKTLESPLNSKKIKPVDPKGNQSWIFSGKTDAKAEAPILWPPDWKSWLIRKDPDAGNDRRQEEKGTTEDEMVGWHHQLNGHESEQTPEDGEGQGEPSMLHSMGSQSRTQLRDWETTNMYKTLQQKYALTKVEGKKDKILIHVTTWISLENIVLSEISQSQNANHIMWSHIYELPLSWIHRDRN